MDKRNVQKWIKTDKTDQKGQNWDQNIHKQNKKGSKGPKRDQISNVLPEKCLKSTGKVQGIACHCSGMTPHYAKLEDDKGEVGELLGRTSQAKCGDKSHAKPTVHSEGEHNKDSLCKS